MSLLKSIAGIRGTIGGTTGENLTPLDIVKFTAAFATIITEGEKAPRIVVGRDGRISGPMVQQLVLQTLIGLGVDVIDLGLSTTPTVEIAVPTEKADGGIIITASHNTKEWNALKLLNSAGEFIDAETGKRVLQLAAEQHFQFAPVDKLGSIVAKDYLAFHLDAVINYPLVDSSVIATRQLKIVVDAINSTGAIYVSALLNKLGVQDVVVINEKINGQFAHNPEPLPEHLSDLCDEVVRQRADLGIAVDPDVDRLCFVNEDGTLFGEEYTLVAVADYILSKRKGNTVSNMSSTRSLREVTAIRGGLYTPAAVGEVNVISKMKETNAVIGGEGNGGIIVPDFHYGRDALIGIGLFLTHFANQDKAMSVFRKNFPNYFISKNKIKLPADVNLTELLDKLALKYGKQPINREDGLRIEFDQDWVHLRASHTEPIVRIYAESDLEAKANNIAQQLLRDIRENSHSES
ncbi:MAG: phosphoglucosamine mutase [Bacteroidetes bacterium]|nr:phosphoglucosamine mutase [Bacteroidota bacterium]